MTAKSVAVFSLCLCLSARISQKVFSTNFDDFFEELDVRLATGNGKGAST